MSKVKPVAGSTDTALPEMPPRPQVWGMRTEPDWFGASAAAETTSTPRGGIVRSVESVALMVMRNVEDHVLRKPGQSINVRVPVDVALYILNGKRNTLATLEHKYGLSINLVADQLRDILNPRLQR